MGRCRFWSFHTSAPARAAPVANAAVKGMSGIGCLSGGAKEVEGSVRRTAGLAAVRSARAQPTTFHAQMASLSSLAARNAIFLLAWI
jgi:hypothetical protein